MGGRWIVLPQKDNELVVDEESHSKIKIRYLSQRRISKKYKIINKIQVHLTFSSSNLAPLSLVGSLAPHSDLASSKILCIILLCSSESSSNRPY